MNETLKERLGVDDFQLHELEVRVNVRLDDHNAQLYIRRGRRRDVVIKVPARGPIRILVWTHEFNREELSNTCAQTFRDTEYYSFEPCVRGAERGNVAFFYPRMVNGGRIMPSELFANIDRVNEVVEVVMEELRAAGILSDVD